MKRIGILGGASDQATADYYRRLNKAANVALGGLNTAELLISSMNFAFAADCIKHNKWAEVASYLKDRAEALECAGAELLICVSNSLHCVADIVTADLHIPFLHIADPTGVAILAAGFSKIGLLGTRSTMAGPYLKGYYADHFAIAISVPEIEEQEALDRIIFTELCNGIFKSQTKALVLRLIERLHATGAQGVILGCTEIPLLLSQSDLPAVPMFDTTALHIQAVIKAAIPSVDP